jgi:hypothetical protein
MRLPPAFPHQRPRSRNCAVAPAGTATPAIGADADAADQCSGTSPDATRRTGNRSGRQPLISVEDLHAEWEIAAIEFLQALINHQRIDCFHRLMAFALNRSRDAELHLTVVARVKSDCQLFSVLFDRDYAAFDRGDVRGVTTRKGEAKFHGFNRIRSGLRL